MTAPTLAQVRKAIREDVPPLCPNRKRHARAPEGYLAWHAWAEEKAKTHTQVRCEGCDRWVVWVPKASVHGTEDES